MLAHLFINSIFSGHDQSKFNVSVLKMMSVLTNPFSTLYITRDFCNFVPMLFKVINYIFLNLIYNLMSQVYCELAI